MINLPKIYLENMEKLLGNEYGEFFRSYEEKSVKGLRFNPLKAREETIEMLVNEWKLEKIPWAEYGWFYNDEVRPGLSPYHDAGVFYIQEPSAMSVSELCGFNENEAVLDLCAAPGGKSGRAAELCGVLLSNEIIPQRARILSSNIERMGYGNVCVSQGSPAELSNVFPEYFDAVICDAPCSGEGMMRKDQTAVNEWSPENVALCTERQREILREAAAMVKPGGRLSYSTCTFEACENEEQAEWFIKEFPSFEIAEMKRFWPHKERGEGHFVCIFRKKGENCPGSLNREKTLKDIERRLENARVHILRTGIVKGETSTDKKGLKIYEPSHAEIMASVFENVKDGVNLTDISLCNAYLRGEVLRLSEGNAVIKGKEGFTGVYFDGYPLGPGKLKGDTVKNHLPKGLRRYT